MPAAASVWPATAGIVLAVAVAAPVSSAHASEIVAPVPASPRSIPFDCEMRVRVTDPGLSIGALQFEIDYSSTDGFVQGTYGTADCHALVGDFAQFNDDDDARVLTAAIVDLSGFETPALVASCTFVPVSGKPTPDSFTVTVTDASTPDIVPIAPKPTISLGFNCAFGATTTTSTTLLPPLPSWLCGRPCAASLGDEPTATDALLVLAAAVGLKACDPCLCDVDGSGTIAAVDALRVLLRSVGLPVALDCDPCEPGVLSPCDAQSRTPGSGNGIGGVPQQRVRF